MTLAEFIGVSGSAGGQLQNGAEFSTIEYDSYQAMYTLGKTEATLG